MIHVRFANITFFLICVQALLLISAPGSYGAGGPEAAGPVVATTSWTAAFARAAGIEEVYVLAPFELQHPAEYELKPSDITIVLEAEIVIFAGYERMVPRINEAVGGEGPRLVQIATDYSLETIRESVLASAAITGSQNEAQKSITAIESFYADWTEDIEKLGYSEAKVLTHVFQRALAEELGIQIAAVFGPGPIEAGQLIDLTQDDVDLIIDNWHNSVAGPFEETMPDAPIVMFINFPGFRDTRTLLDVLWENRRVLDALLDG